jgi:cardiolipin synthase (CMP-forming)
MRKQGGLGGAREFFAGAAHDIREAFARPHSAARACIRMVFQMAGVAALLAGLVPVLAGDPAAAVGSVLWTLAGAAVTAGLVVATAGLLRRPDGSELPAPGLPNSLTLLRFVLIAPTVVLLLHGRVAGAVLGYGVLALTDIVDGIVARSRGPISRFGVVMDPLADVFSTFALFTAFRCLGLVPGWLYAILIIRYGMLFIGSFALFVAVGPIDFQSTIPGKGVGVVQATGAMAILWGAAHGGLPDPVREPLFAFLGLGFASIVISQFLIGWRHTRSARRGRAIRRGSSR